MDTTQKLDVLGAAADYDVCAASCAPRRRRKAPLIYGQSVKSRTARPLLAGQACLPAGKASQFISRATTSSGKKVSLFKVLQTNHCEKNCFYCVNQRGRDHPRTTFKPDELARLFMALYEKRQVDGLFLSSAISGGADRSMERMIATVEILRNKYKYKGYVHLKTLPGASRAAIERACGLASRTSVNLEAPRRESLAKIAPEKDLILDILDPLRWIATEMRQTPLSAPYGQPGLAAGVTTQFVVGAGGETDEEIIKSTAWLYKNLRLHRAYFSAFRPVEDTPLDGLEQTPPLREHRLYQADFLLRQYHFTAAELPFERSGNLPLDKDPKLTWALRHPSMFPVEVNQVSEAMLLRVPGIGPISARRIVEARCQGKIKTLRSLARTGAVVKRARNFLTLAGKYYPGEDAPEGTSGEAPGLFTAQAVGF